jgi:hypothetical protein
MRRIGWIDKFRRPNVTQARTRFLLNSTGPLIPNGVCKNELLKAETLKGEIHYRFNCFGHQSSTPILSGEPKSSGSRGCLVAKALSSR